MANSQSDEVVNLKYLSRSYTIEERVNRYFATGCTVLCHKVTGTVRRVFIDDFFGRDDLEHITPLKRAACCSNNGKERYVQHKHLAHSLPYGEKNGDYT